MILIKKFIISIIILLTIIRCDTKKEYLDDVKLNLLCYSFSFCNHSQPSQIGMIGDSWTDIIVGYPLIETLRIQLEQNHGYQITGATLAGQTMEAALGAGLHYQVIDQAGANIKVILLSLGGNDIQADLKDYYNNLESTRSSRFNAIKVNLKRMIQTGNAYKTSKYGGEPIKWIIHGYDYSNPNMTAIEYVSNEGCTSRFTAAGFAASSVIDFSSTQLNAYNELLRSILAEEPYLYYIDLRQTLGGPPVSKAEWMLDCIHPNNLGFKLLGNRLSTLISPITGLNP